MTLPQKSPSHQTIVTKAKEYIELHWQENLSLEQIAGHVFVSPFHFQRIFKSETGETPKEFLTRVRLENAIQRIRIDVHKSAFEVGMECGFSSQAVFARAFRQKFGVSATQFRNMTFAEVSKLAVWEPSIQKAFKHMLVKKVSEEERKQFYKSLTFKRTEPLTVIYHPTTMLSEEHLGEEFEKLARRAAAYDVEVDTSHCYGAMYDFPLHTPLEKCRYRVCIGVPAESAKLSKFSTMTIPGGKFGAFPLKGNIELMIRLSILFFDEWLRASNFERSEHYYLERFSALPGPKTYTKLPREVYVPLKPV